MLAIVTYMTVVELVLAMESDSITVAMRVPAPLTGGSGKSEGGTLYMVLVRVEFVFLFTKSTTVPAMIVVLYDARVQPSSKTVTDSYEQFAVQPALAVTSGALTVAED